MFDQYMLKSYMLNFILISSILLFPLFCNYFSYIHSMLLVFYLTPDNEDTSLRDDTNEPPRCKQRGIRPVSE